MSSEEYSDRRVRTRATKLTIVARALRWFATGVAVLAAVPLVFIFGVWVWSQFDGSTLVVDGWWHLVIVEAVALAVCALAVATRKSIQRRVLVLNAGAS